MMKWRSIILLALFASEGKLATAGEPIAEAGTLDTGVRIVNVDVPDPIVPAAEPVVAEPVVAEPELPIPEVRWTVPRSMPVNELAALWGVRTQTLVELNPELDGLAGAQAGSELVVFVDDPDEPTESVGSPHRGRLKNGLPMPEGPYWSLRDRRVRAFGADGTVRSLIKAFTVYGQTHPGAQLVHLGEISGRTGGRARPHVSHRTGRDVDIGYIMKPGVLGDRHWKRATPETLDVEKTWTLIKALGDTGRVQRMFISSRLQVPLKEYARTQVSRDELAKYFRDPSLGSGQRYLITHENGHRDHLHVRFRCDPEDRRCRGWGLFPFEPPPAAVGSVPSTAAP